MSEVTGIKLINGYEIFGKIVEETAESYRISDALIAHAEPTAEGKMAFQFVPLTFLAEPQGKPQEDGIYPINGTFPKSAILCVYTPAGSLIDRYNKKTSSIIAPTSKIIV